MSHKTYRRIYEEHYGPIPREESGRSFHIHHIDGNRNNNAPENLVALSIQDHYDLHYRQGDWAAAKMLAMQMKRSPELISELSKQAQQKRIENGTHNFLNREWQRQQAEKSAAKKRKVRPPKSLNHGSSKPYKVIFPNGEEEIIVNLAKFCRDNSLNQGNMVSVSKGRLSQHKGYKICSL